jgi:Fe2+ or Zn2+ uptake regulation protein
MDELADHRAARALREAGMRVTPQRQAIWLLLHEEEEAGHQTAEEVFLRIHERMPALARATVYNVLNDFVDAGLLQRVDGMSGPALYDRNLDQRHQHFRCTVCGGLFDVRPRLPAPVELLEPGFAVERVQMVLEGVCPTCRRGAAG